MTENEWNSWYILRLKDMLLFRLLSSWYPWQCRCKDIAKVFSWFSANANRIFVEIWFSRSTEPILSVKTWLFRKLFALVMFRYHEHRINSFCFSSFFLFFLFISRWIQIGITCSIDHIQNWQRKVKFCIFNKIHRRQFSLGYANLLLRSTYHFQLHSKFCVSEKTDILVVSTCVNLTGRTAFSTTTNGRQKQIELPINAMTGISISFLFTSNHFRISFWSDLSAWWFFKCQSFTLLSLLVRWLKRFAEAILYQCYFLDKIWEKINRMQI